MSHPLTPAARRELKARAHGLRPVVMIGADGVSEAVMHEIESGLRAHELIKVRVLAADRAEREAMLDQICRLSGATAVQHIGKVLVLYRERRAESQGSAAPELHGSSRGNEPRFAGGAATARRPNARKKIGRAGEGKRWTFIREQGRPGRAPKRPSRARRPQRRIGAGKGRAR